MLTRVLITGHNGYIGSVMAPMLLERGYDVIGLDIGYYDQCSFGRLGARVPSVHKDIRDIDASDLRGFDAVIHLAALSNDPVGNLNECWTKDINFRASVRLAELAKGAGVRRFLFSSSCIIYGMSEALVVNEDSPVNPQTAYARSKVESERSIAQLSDDSFSPTFLRNGTVYGVSPRMRFDTVLNNLMGAAFTTGRIVVYGDGSPWRPAVHVEDVSRTFIAVLEAPVEVVHRQVLNVGTERLNRQIRALAEIVAKAVPGSQIEYRGEPDVDRRTYKADFAKIGRVLPHFQIEWPVERGAKALYEAFVEAGLTYRDFVDQRFSRVRWIRHLMDAGRLDRELRWRS